MSPRRTRQRMEQRHQPRDLTPPPGDRPAPIVIERPKGRLPGQGWIPSAQDIAGAELERDLNNAERQRQARVRRGIDWTVCIVPGCGQEPPMYLTPKVSKADEHNPDVWLPVCKLHGSTIWRTMNEVWKDPQVQADMLAADVRYNEAVEAREKRDREADGPGYIYVLRQNGLIKVGWSGQIMSRLKDYGPNVEILCTFPGSRGDETNLHRQLRGSLAVGHEWYHDDDVLALFVERAIEKHGPPTHQAWWSRPKGPTMRYIKTR